MNSYRYCKLLRCRPLNKAHHVLPRQGNQERIRDKARETAELGKSLDLQHPCKTWARQFIPIIQVLARQWQVDPWNTGKPIQLNDKLCTQPVSETKVKNNRETHDSTSCLKTLAHPCTEWEGWRLLSMVDLLTPNTGSSSSAFSSSSFLLCLSKLILFPLPLYWGSLATAR